MTIFGRDSSHYTQSITDSNLKGLSFHTCKLTDGLHYYEDSTYKVQTDRAHNIGVPVLGSYHVLWGNRDLAGQADWWLQRVNALVPYWKSMPWVWQPDCESFGYNGLPTIDQINTFGDMICTKAGVPAERYTPYAPAWVYGDKLKSLRYKNYWGSNYGSNPSGHYVTVYPGDNSTRWNTYIPMTILQYGSNTDIGDANAFRGTLQQFLNAIKASGTTVKKGNDMPIFFEDEAGTQFMADSTFQQCWTFNDFTLWKKIYAAAGSPTTSKVLTVDVTAGVYGQHMGLYTVPRTAPATGAPGKDGKDGVDGKDGSVKVGDVLTLGTTATVTEVQGQ